jgi:DNA-directed RNA polymerase subunit RPC12/RpoP
MKTEKPDKPEKKTTYEMEFICSNCQTDFIREIPLGIPASDQGGECPYCGYADGYIGRRFVYKKPFGARHDR